MNLLLGPLLGLESDELYSFCFVINNSDLDIEVHLSNGQVAKASVVKKMHLATFYRAQVLIPSPSKAMTISYQLKSKDGLLADKNSRRAWSFYLAAKNEQPQFIYTSCNGFSSASAVINTTDPYHLWKRIKKEHSERLALHAQDQQSEDKPYSLLLMGGDQLYADSIWSDVDELKKWSSKSYSEKLAKKSTKALKEQVAKFYEKLYFDRWNQPETSLMLASIPSVMMWDDHDIFDGWGSYPQELQSCDVYKTIFSAARHYFELFQIRSAANSSLIKLENQHYSFAFCFRGTHILALDNRSQRSTKQIMSRPQWTDIIDYLDSEVNSGNLFVLSAVPIVYRDFSAVETYFELTPWEEELSDDLKDHWRAKEHQGERLRLIHRLLSNARKRKAELAMSKTLILSGDVHVGCIGVITDKTGEQPIKLHQVVSSAIVHPAPSKLAWLGIVTSTNDRDESLNEDDTITAKMLTPVHSNKYIRCRNYATIATGSDTKLWINWQTENKDKPCYPID